MIDNALNGLKYTDQDKYEEVDSPLYIIDSVEDIENVSTKSLLGVADFANCGVTVDQMKNVLLRFNENATYNDLMDLMNSDSMTVDRF